jgi:plasmid maintenance system killer protein
MELYEAKEVLKENGYLMESVKIDFRPLDKELESLRRNIEETKEQFQALTDELQEKLFSKMSDAPDIYILKDYPFSGYNIVYENKNLSICVNKSWRVSINGKKFKEIWSQKDAIQTILDNVK